MKQEPTEALEGAEDEAEEEAAMARAMEAFANGATEFAEPEEVFVEETEVDMTAAAGSGAALPPDVAALFRAMGKGLDGGAVPLPDELSEDEDAK